MFSPDIQDKVQQTGDLRTYLKQIDLSALRNGQELVKVALHGFRGDVHELLRLYVKGEIEYSCQHGEDP